jgi:type IV pilus assembly protein PilW
MMKEKSSFTPSSSDPAGYTLVELMAALTLSAVVMSGVFSAYFAQQKAYRTQVKMAELQQNLRAAMYFLERDVRSAGCDPTGKAGAGIVAAGASFLRFTADFDGDGSIQSNEDISYSLYDSGGDGDTDIGRAVGGGNRQPLALNIDALDFRYIDEEGVILDDDGSGGVTANLDRVRSIQITIVARAATADPGYRNRTNYYNLIDSVNPVLPAPDDRFRRRSLATEIRCRNLKL